MENDHCCKHEPEIATMVTEVKYIKEAVDSLTKAIMGNGKIGLGDRVLIMEQKHNEIDDIKKSFRVFKKSIEDKMVTKNDFFIGGKVGKWILTGLKILVWAIAIAVILASGGYLPLF